MRQHLGKREQQREAVAALRFELQLDRKSMSEIFQTHILLRDEAFLEVKARGHVSYLPAPIPMTLMGVYNQMYTVNRLVRRLRDMQLPEITEGFRHEHKAYRLSDDEGRRRAHAIDGSTVPSYRETLSAALTHG